MSLYKIFERPSNEIQSVKQGFSWPIFLYASAVTSFVTLIIFLFMYRLAAVNNMKEFMAGGLTASEATVLFEFTVVIIVNLILGFVANVVICKTLIKKGFKEVTRLIAKSPDNAVFQYIKEKEEHHFNYQ